MKSQNEQPGRPATAVPPSLVAGLCLAVFAMIGVILAYAAWTASDRFSGEHLHTEVRLAVQRGETVDAPHVMLSQPLSAKTPAK
jgi:hypothetical protein